MNSADLLRHRLEAAARESPRLNTMLTAVTLGCDAAMDELQEMGFSDSDCLLAASLLAGDLTRRAAERLL